MRKSSPRTILARRLRREATDAENRLWLHLRSRQLGGVKFRRQQPVGSFTVDFCALEVKLVVELDGGQHADRQAQDADRSAFLERSGFRVLRFWNNQVLENLEGVLERIAEVAAAGAPRDKR